MQIELPIAGTRPSEGKGHTFESCRVRQYYQVLSQFWRFSIIACVTVVSLPDFRASHAGHGSLGDPMQLSQPIQGAHPGESGLSALEYLLASHNTVPADRGIFLPVSRRMHPDVCRFISDIVYEGRLTSDDGAARQKILGDSTGHLSGARLIEVSHVGKLAIGT
jgi:hypothetical protein